MYIGEGKKKDMSNIRLDSDTYSYELIKRGLDAASLRGKAIANNIANINTKGYKKFNVTFEETLSDNSEEMLQKGYVSKEDNQFGSIAVKKDTTTSMREDGNNVDLEQEKVNQAANTMMYNALITQANNKLNMTRYVITGGSR